MDSWDTQIPSPDLKFEDSPAESFLSTPGDMYPSLFAAGSPTTMNPLEIMARQSHPDDQSRDITPIAGLAPSVLETSPAPSSSNNTEKKPVKKRKSWGQVLPEPKTNLPPRKRAKTEDEKEQRRVERVLRNRRAAQSSRERKRLEVEALERRNKELEAMLRHLQQTNLALVEELRLAQRTSGVLPRASSQFDALRPGPVTFSQELFSSQDGHASSADQPSRSIEEFLLSAGPDNTVNPASLSPARTPSLSPAQEEREEKKDGEPAPARAEALAEAAAASAPAVASPNATQHPAEMLCDDLQCRLAEAPRSWRTAASPRPPLHPALALLLPLQLLLASTSALVSICQRPLMQIAMSLRAGFSLPPTPPILNAIIWLVTTPPPSPSRSRPPTASTPSTSTSSSSTTNSACSPPPTSSSSSSSSTVPTAPKLPTRPSATLRLKSLRKILSCSPTLARPLTDATMAVLRLASTERQAVDRVPGCGGSEAAADLGGAASQQLLPQQLDGEEETAGWFQGVQLPSREVLLTLLWAIRVEERRLQIKERVAASTRESGRQSVCRSSKTLPTTTSKDQKFVLKVVPKRAWEADHFDDGMTCSKRRRSG